MTKKNLTALIASTAILTACSSNSSPIDKELLRQMSSVGDGCEICRRLNYNYLKQGKGGYEGYTVEAYLFEDKKRHTKWSLLEITDESKGKTVARIHAEDSDADGPKPFLINMETSSSLQRNHPFKRYTAEKLAEIYNSVINERIQQH